MRMLLAVAAMSLGLGLAGCSNTGTTSASSRPSNSDFEHTVQNQWASNPAFRDLKVSVDADKNEMTLTGNVANEADRQQAVSLAKTAMPGSTVTDKIDVKPNDAPTSATPATSTSPGNPTR